MTTALRISVSVKTMEYLRKLAELSHLPVVQVTENLLEEVAGSTVEFLDKARELELDKNPRDLSRLGEFARLAHSHLDHRIRKGGP